MASGGNFPGGGRGAGGGRGRGGTGRGSGGAGGGSGMPELDYDKLASAVLRLQQQQQQQQQQPPQPPQPQSQPARIPGEGMPKVTQEEVEFGLGAAARNEEKRRRQVEQWRREEQEDRERKRPRVPAATRQQAKPPVANPPAAQPVFTQEQRSIRDYEAALKKGPDFSKFPASVRGRRDLFRIDRWGRWYIDIQSDGKSWYLQPDDQRRKQWLEMHGCFARCAGCKALNLQCDHILPECGPCRASGIDCQWRAGSYLEHEPQGIITESVLGECLMFYAWLWAQEGDERNPRKGMEKVLAFKSKLWKWPEFLKKSEEDAVRLPPEGMALAQSGEKRTSRHGYAGPFPMAWVAEKFRPDISRNPERMAQLRNHWEKKEQQKVDAAHLAANKDLLERHRRDAEEAKKKAEAAKKAVEDAKKQQAPPAPVPTVAPSRPPVDLTGVTAEMRAEIPRVPRAMASEYASVEDLWAACVRSSRVQMNALRYLDEEEDEEEPQTTPGARSSYEMEEIFIKTEPHAGLKQKRDVIGVFKRKT
ncbi:hypothetical protein KC340_g8787 [Hortaea werneckii]|nr:hypothetical protein KC342_g9384 [Hortaea werneckii]KAI7108183.1 hypothetical protein KC339_g1754 [Hortaea werneckii]KAI7244723.1 hypothetical protein KC365_g1145 [Hortaea werneckii]KAI7315971.1 hypothetical protein KC340_g8787 [Hortaea werneckii]KAI7397949.1 hypothetical protein KC328_g4665 [Hortaea werneckii]